MYAITSSVSVLVSTRFGIVGWEVFKNTLRDRAVVEGIAATAENAGALLFMAPWQRRHLASARCLPAAGSPISWLKAHATFASRRRLRPHENEWTGM
jgi:hypothetical protein